MITLCLDLLFSVSVVQVLSTRDRQPRERISGRRLKITKEMVA